MEIIDQFREFLVSYLRGKESPVKRSYPWKESWEYTVAHSMRVEQYALKLIEAEGGLRDEEVLLVRAAALMHDIGSLDDRRNHARVGAKIVRNWCFNKPIIEEYLNIKTLTSMISTHRKKDGKEKKLTLAILKDADILDELGAMSVFMIAHQINPGSHDYYAQILNHLEKDEFAFIRKQKSRLSTRSAHAILERKFDFVKGFAGQLKEELMGTQELHL